MRTAIIYCDYCADDIATTRLHTAGGDYGVCDTCAPDLDGYGLPSHMPDVLSLLAERF